MEMGWNVIYDDDDGLTIQMRRGRKPQIECVEGKQAPYKKEEE